MDLAQAIQILQELVGRPANINLSVRMKGVTGPIRVRSIDYFADREHRCVIGGDGGSEATQPTLRRPVVDISYDRRFTEADATIASAPIDDLRAAVEQALGDNDETG